MKARRERRLDKMMARSIATVIELEELARFRRELAASDLPEVTKTLLGFLADPIGCAADAAAKIAAQRDNEEGETDEGEQLIPGRYEEALLAQGVGVDLATCELCVDPIDKPHVDEDGAKRWRPCPNPATREVLDDNGKPLRVCEEHFRKEAS